MKYILVTGGVISGIGKGIIASSIGTILKSCGLHVTSIKIDPYINIDAGTFSPYEHGGCRERRGVRVGAWPGRSHLRCVVEEPGPAGLNGAVLFVIATPQLAVSTKGGVFLH